MRVVLSNYMNDVHIKQLMEVAMDQLMYSRVAPPC